MAEESRITVSEDKLYRALAEAKADIIESINDAVRPLEARVRALELANAGQTAVQETSRYKQAKVPTVIAALVSATITAVSNHFSIH